ncbi:MAG: TIGR01777 family oxidoreductase [Saprospiraceae bacterium]
MEQADSVLIAGGTGMVGERLTNILIQNGYKVMLLSRRKHSNGNIPVYHWDTDDNSIDENAILRADHIINLSGENIAAERWTKERKKQLIESRTKSAALLFDTCQRLQCFPKTYISASAIGYYGDRGSEILDEESSEGGGFLAECCIAWEAGIQKWIESGARTITYRIGLVLSTKGGVMAETIKPLRFGLATFFGSGKQYNSWIHIDDLCGLFQLAIEDEEMSGIFNAVSPNPVSNFEFTRSLAKAWRKPYLLLPVPSFVLQLMLGESAAMILGSSIVSSAKAEQHGFVFQFPDLSIAFTDLIQRGK